MPHLHWVQPQPPFSAAISMPPALLHVPPKKKKIECMMMYELRRREGTYALWVAVAETRRVAPAASTSGYMLQPPQPLPHLQALPQPQFPPQQDIVEVAWDWMEALIGVG